MLGYAQGRQLRLKNVTRGHGSAAGFTLIELMAVVTIFAILALLGVPMYSTFMANTQIRSAAESITGGLRLAQAEAVKRNGRVEFVLDESTGWQVNEVASNATIQRYKWADGAPKAVITSGSDVRRIEFDGLGRLAKNVAARFDVGTSITNAEPRTLSVVVDPWNGIKLCDSHLPSVDPAGCPQTPQS